VYAFATTTLPPLVFVYAVAPLPPEHPLRRLPTATLSPHLGYVTREMLSAFYADMVEAVDAWLDGAPVRIANPEALGHGRR
jgi:phosphoglycerate dehydrogenase-like enzyme